MTAPTKKSMRRSPTGFLGVVCWQPKHEVNVGTLWRSSFLYGANFIGTVGRRYVQQASDTSKTSQRVPMIHYRDIDDLVEHLPNGCPLIGVELDERATPLSKFQFPPSGVLLLGAEDHGLPPKVLDRCHHLIQIESPQPWSMNVATAGTICLHSRYIQRQR